MHRPLFRAHLTRTRRLITTACIITGLLAGSLTMAACTKPAADAVPTDPSCPTLTAAATALDKRDAAAFLETVSGPLREALAGNLDLSGPGAGQLAKLLREAKLVAEYETIRVYEVTLDNETFGFMAVKEGDKWLLAGL